MRSATGGGEFTASRTGRGDAPRVQPAEIELAMIRRGFDRQGRLGFGGGLLR